MKTDLSISRRLFLDFLRSLPFTQVNVQAALAVNAPEPHQALELGPATAFSFEQLKREAARLARQTYVPRPNPAARLVHQIDFDQHQKIYQPVQQGLYGSPDGDGAVSLLHLARLFPHPVSIHVLENGLSRELKYRKRYFRYPRDSPAARMPEGVGFAGFRLHRRGDPIGLETGRAPDWMSFLGASYFRSSGDLDQYGISARGLAIDTAVPGRTEEFPAFTKFWIEKRPTDFIVFALLESESITGAYTFEIAKAPNVVTTVRARLFPRRNDIGCLGVAPLTSMYWYSETNRWVGHDWRPEVHDSDGLLMHNGAGEWLWRPLNNPPRLSVSTFLDEKPRGFGLLQRDRSLSSYVDPVAFERRPNLWVEPLDVWPRGEVHLVEIPTNTEYADNIVVYFKPAEAPQVDRPIDISYRLHWSGDRILPTRLARVIATRMTKPWANTLRVAESVPVTDARPYSRKVMIEFKGDKLGEIGLENLIPVVDGVIAGHDVELVRAPDRDQTHLRLIFDVSGHEDDPTDIRAFLLGPDGPATSTVLAQIWLR
ncbi:MAG: glucan biosynthesis protein [Methylocystis sp.]